MYNRKEGGGEGKGRERGGGREREGEREREIEQLWLNRRIVYTDLY